MKTNLIFKLNKIAFNNSCNSNFVSLSFDENTHISGKNGSGKSSKLNGVQLGFLPPTSFKNSKKNFYFKSSKGNYYSDQDCYDFYFPHNNSFIVYEFTNPNGTFCQILYKGKSELSIERGFVPLTFDEIEEWFWTFPEGDELGYPTRIQRSELIDKIKAVKNSKIVKTTKDALETLYNSDFNDDSSRFAIATVNENRKNNVVDIFKLTTNASEIDDEMLRKTITSLLKTSYKDNKRDLVDYNPVQIMQEFDRLEDEKRSINKKKNLEANFNSLNSLFSDVIGYSQELKEKFQLCLDYNIDFIEKNKDVLKNARISKEEAIAQKKSLQAEGTELNKKSSMKKGELNILKKNVAKLEEKLEEYNAIFAEDHDSGLSMWKNNPEDAITYLQTQISEDSNELKKYKNIEKVIKTLKTDKGTLKAKNKKLEILNTTLKNQGNLLFSADKLDNPNILYGINEAFSSLQDNLTDEQIEIMNQFSAIFSEENGQVVLGGISFGHTKKFNFSKEETIKEIEELESEISSLKLDIDKNQKIIDEEDTEYKEQLQRDIKKSQNEVKIISNGKDNSKELKSEKTALEISLKEFNEIEKQVKDYRVVYKEVNKNQADKIAECKAIEDLVSKANTMKSKLETMKKAHNFNYVKDENLTSTTTEVKDSDLDYISDLFKSVENGRKEIMSGLELFVENKILSDDNSLLKVSNISIKDLKINLFDKIKDIYQSLEDSEESLEKAFQQHANTTIEISNTLKDQVKHFKLFESDINKSMQKFKLSSIDEMKISIELEPRVKNFIQTIENASLLSDDASGILEQGLGEKIKNFITDMGLENKKNMQINTEAMIKSVSFKYNIEGKWTTKDGSTGTSTVASVMLLSIFINKICGDNITLSIPVNLDETGNIDYGNMMTLHDFLKEQELILFSASPEPQISSGDIFKVLINFDDSIIFDKDRLMDDKNRSTYHYKMGSILNEVKHRIQIVDFESKIDIRSDIKNDIKNDIEGVQ
ncbi:MAG: hypothetical protein CL760_00870 [Chloroflexi bacterium]|nr:hypothetical protein [Chloroflexota bacterium]|tara:strand:+ start:29014 stop:31989 length:2976 start_codon:yes stop_codon:yes gene_type:complete